MQRLSDSSYASPDAPINVTPSNPEGNFQHRKRLPPHPPAIPNVNTKRGGRNRQGSLVSSYQHEALGFSTQGKPLTRTPALNIAPPSAVDRAEFLVRYQAMRLYSSLFSIPACTVEQPPSPLSTPASLNEGSEAPRTVFRSLMHIESWILVRFSPYCSTDLNVHRTENHWSAHVPQAYGPGCLGPSSIASMLNQSLLFSSWN
jgi:hypothetical protein